jgi:hypothetical protein
VDAGSHASTPVASMTRGRPLCVVRIPVAEIQVPASWVSVQDGPAFAVVPTSVSASALPTRTQGARGSVGRRLLLDRARCKSSTGAAGNPRARLIFVVVFVTMPR